VAEPRDLAGATGLDDHLGEFGGIAEPAENIEPAPGVGVAATVSSCGSTFWPGMARRMPATTTRSAGLSPLSITGRSRLGADGGLPLLDRIVLVEHEQVTPALIGAERGVSRARRRRQRARARNCRAPAPARDSAGSRARQAFRSRGRWWE